MNIPTVRGIWIVLVCVLPLLAAAAEAVVLRPERVHALVVENTGSVLLREGRETVRRVLLEGACVGLPAAARVDFQIGAALLSSHEAGREVSVTVKNAPSVVSSTTPHLHLVASEGDERTACRVARIEASTAAEFDAAGGPGAVRDQRRDAAGR